MFKKKVEKLNKPNAGSLRKNPYCQLQIGTCQDGCQ